MEAILTDSGWAQMYHHVAENCQSTQKLDRDTIRSADIDELLEDEMFASAMPPCSNKPKPKVISEEIRTRSANMGNMMQDVRVHEEFIQSESTQGHTDNKFLYFGALL